MSTDKTLADVQPGGRVRLGDGLPPLPKAGYVTGGDFGHEAHNAFTPEQMRDYAIAALSAQPSPSEKAAHCPVKHCGMTYARVPADGRCHACGATVQPSPGGQGDSRSEKAETFLRQYLTYLRSSPRQGLRPRWCDVYEALEIAIEALSAQPSPGGQGDDLAVELLATELERDGNDQAASAIRSGDTTYGMKLLHAALRAITAALAARQPVGEPVGFQFRSRQWAEDEFTGPWLNPNVPNRAHYDSRPANYETRSIYAALPAQAVDLGAVRALLQRRIEQWRSHLPADPGAPGTREIETKGEHDYNNDVRIYREGIAVMEEVLSKIDGQAVGNG